MNGWDPYFEQRLQYLARCKRAYEESHRWDDCPHCAVLKAEITILETTEYRIQRENYQLRERLKVNGEGKLMVPPGRIKTMIWQR